MAAPNRRLYDNVGQALSPANNRLRVGRRKRLPHVC
jgi:hypothetical protein